MKSLTISQTVNHLFVHHLYIVYISYLLAILVIRWVIREGERERDHIYMTLILYVVIIILFYYYCC